MLISTKTLDQITKTAQKRLENIKEQQRIYGSEQALKVGHEIGALYNLVIQLAEAVKTLQTDYNRGFGAE